MRRTEDTGGAPPPGGPDLTVVMPVLNGVGVLERSLAALEASDLDPSLWEVLVVDDGSDDGTTARVRERGHRVIRVPGGPRGPAAARNLGVDASTADVVVFVDADVCVHPDALRRFRNAFIRQPDVGAVFGTYDDHPADPGFLSQYRNLYHRWVHLRGAGEAETFWAGCGAVRRSLFRSLGGFDTRRFPRPQIEDIELGYRIRDAGWRILLDPDIEATHLKRWTFGAMVRTDLFDRGLPWMRLLLAAPRASSLNIGAGDRLRTALVGVACVLALAGAVTRDPWIAASTLLPLAATVLSNLGLFRWFAARRGPGFALRVVPLNLLFHLLAGVAVVLALGAHLTARVRHGAPGGEEPRGGVTPSASPPTFPPGRRAAHSSPHERRPRSDDGLASSPESR